jgi:signal transduction histidine kinase
VASRLERLLRDFRELTGTTVDLALRGDAASLSPAAADVLQKTLQEALVNVAKHARAAQTHVVIDIGDGWASIEVADDGVGLSIGGTEAVGTLPGHFGLRQMRERIEGAGGRLEVVGHPGAGVTIKGTFPAAAGGV